VGSKVVKLVLTGLMAVAAVGLVSGFAVEDDPRVSTETIALGQVAGAGAGKPTG